MKRSLSFAKMHGSGNDFILIDNRDRSIKSSMAASVAERLCRRKFGVGADGLILIEESSVADFKWGFYNADGSEAEMCGNGGRCAARFAFMEGIAPENLSFETLAGIIRAEVTGKRVKLQMSPPEDLRLDINLKIREDDFTINTLNTGVPHAVMLVKDIEATPVFEWGRFIRYHSLFQPEGTNVNFVEVTDTHNIRIRTYERGVEDETLACGTGAVASAIICAIKGLAESPVDVRTWGGEILTIYFNLADAKDRVADQVFLKGDAVLVYRGKLGQDVMEFIWQSRGAKNRP